MNIKKPHQLRQSQFLRCTEHFNGLPQTVQLVRYIQVRLIDLLDQLLRSCPLDDINFTVYVKLIVPGNKIYVLGNVNPCCFFSDQIIFCMCPKRNLSLLACIFRAASKSVFPWAVLIKALFPRLISPSPLLPGCCWDRESPVSGVSFLLAIVRT